MAELTSSQALVYLLPNQASWDRIRSLSAQPMPPDSFAEWSYLNALLSEAGTVHHQPDGRVDRMGEMVAYVQKTGDLGGLHGAYLSLLNSQQVRSNPGLAQQASDVYQQYAPKQPERPVKGVTPAYNSDTGQLVLLKPGDAQAGRPGTPVSGLINGLISDGAAVIDDAFGTPAAGVGTDVGGRLGDISGHLGSIAGTLAAFGAAGLVIPGGQAVGGVLLVVSGVIAVGAGIAAIAGKVANFIEGAFAQKVDTPDQNAGKFPLDQNQKDILRNPDPQPPATDNAAANDPAGADKAAADAAQLAALQKAAEEQAAQLEAEQKAAEEAAQKEAAEEAARQAEEDKAIAEQAARDEAEQKAADDKAAREQAAQDAADERAAQEEAKQQEADARAAQAQEEADRAAAEATQNQGGEPVNQGDGGGFSEEHKDPIHDIPRVREADETQ